MNPRVISLLLATVLFAQGASIESASLPAQQPSSAAITEALKAMHSATMGTLYSLEPGFQITKDAPADKNFHNNLILGQMDLDPKQLAIVVGEFQGSLDKQAEVDAANPGVYGAGMCDNPRHGLQVKVDGHTYDFLLCFECGHFNIYQDGQHIADMNAKGTPWVLNDMLTAANIPLSKSGQKKEEYEANQKRIDDAHARWVAAMPKSLQPFWQPLRIMPPEVAPMRAPLAAEFPDVTQRIRALLSWYGSGSTDWMNVPMYEEAAISLLRDYSTTEIVAAMQAGPLTDAQLEGAARAFTSYQKQKMNGVPRQPKEALTPQYDFAAIPAPIKATLLEHVLKSKNSYNISFAKWAFSPPPEDDQTPPAPAK